MGFPLALSSPQDPKFRRCAQIFEDLLWADPADEVFEEELDGDGQGLWDTKAAHRCRDAGMLRARDSHRNAMAMLYRCYAAERRG